MSQSKNEPISRRDPEVKLKPGAPSPEQLKARFGRDIFRDFDYDDPNFNKNFVPTLEAHLQHCPVARSKVGTGYWWVSRNEDVRRIGQDWKTFSNALRPRPGPLPSTKPASSAPCVNSISCGNSGRAKPSSESAVP